MPTPFLGEIRQFAGNFAPEGWAFCNGASLKSSDYPDLFRLLGYRYGGDSIIGFKLPDLQGRVPINIGNGFQIAQSGGMEMVALQSDNLPAHSHPVFASAIGTENDPSMNFWGGSKAQPYAQAPGTLSMHPLSISTEGGGNPHENRIPYLAISYIIALDGIYPAAG